MIRAHGNVNATVMLIADGASDSDMNHGYALTGYDEKVLRSLSHAVGLKFDDFWKTALIKERINLKTPDANRTLLSDDYRTILTQEIKSINPNIIVPLSELSFEFVSGISGIRKFRGSVLPSRVDFTGDIKRVIPILGVNPYINEDPKQEIISRIDFGKVKKNELRSDAIPVEGNLWIARNPQALRNFLERNENANLLVFDIETYLNLPTCISICFDGFESVCVPLLDSSISLDERTLMAGMVAKLLAGPIPKVNQNIKFDWRHLERNGFSVANIVGDTMIGAGILYAEFPKNLGFLTSIYTDLPYFKDEGKDFDPSSSGRERLYLYCCKDSLATWQINNQQRTELVETGTEFVYNNLIQVMPVYRQMEENGIQIDDFERNKLLGKYSSLFEVLCYKLYKMAGEKINPLSPKQCGRLIYDDLHFKVVRGIKRSKTGNTSTDEDSLELLLWSSTFDSPREGKEILRTIINCRKVHKVIELLELPLHPDRRFRCEYKLVGTETGRTSAGETTDYFLYFDGSKIKTTNLGHSLQTIGKHGFMIDGEQYGKDLRSMFVPSRGYSFVECDLSQAEARVDAVLASDFDILPRFDDGIGIHRLTGSWVYNCAPELIQKGLVKEEDGTSGDRYYISKTVRHAGERNMREDRLMMMIGKPISYCANVLKKFHENQPNIRGVFHREIRETIQRDRVLVAPNGRRREFYGRIDDHTINEGISTLPQAIVSDQLKFSLKKTFSECPWARPLSEAHDGFLSEVPSGREAEYGRTFESNVVTPIDFRKCSLSRDFELLIPMECEISTTNWKEMKGLRLK